MDAYLAKNDITRVLLVDDEPISRMGLRFLLSDLPHVRIVDELQNGLEAVRYVNSTMPDIILMDVSMPEMDGITATKAIRKISDRVKILMLTAKQTELDLSKALAAGANGYCLKDSTPQQLMDALNVVKDGNIYLDAKVMPLLLSAMTRSGSEEKQASVTAPYAPLNSSELDLIARRMDGVSRNEIARQLGISLLTLTELEQSVQRKMMDLETRPVSSANVHTAKICTQCESVFPYDTDVCSFDGALLETEVLSTRLGNIVGGKYKLVEFLGRGGGASVYRASHRYLANDVAVKIIHSSFSSDFTMLQRFRNEAETLSRMNHPNIVEVNDFGLNSGGTPYLVMELLNGMDLATYLRKRGKLTIEEFVAIFTQVAAALSHAHDHGLLHRDIKTSNIFITESKSGQPLVKLVDFGLALKINNVSSRLTEQGQIVGTPSYMSPEICQGGAESTASDIYSLGCTMFECLTGRLPYTADSSVEVMFKHIREPIPSIDAGTGCFNLEHVIPSIISLCLQKQPSARFKSMHELETALQGISMRWSA